MREPQSPLAAQSSSPEDLKIVSALVSRDEDAFRLLIDRYHSSLRRLAMVYVHDAAVAEDVVQETWLGVLRGIASFEGRSSLKTWIFRILVNQARTRSQRENRLGSLLEKPVLDITSADPAVAPERFLDRSHPTMPGHWRRGPKAWGQDAETQMLTSEALAQIENAIGKLPQNQKEVITLRDVQGWNAEEVCNVLGITETNQRVLLHRARSRVRQSVEDYFEAN